MVRSLRLIVTEKSDIRNWSKKIKSVSPFHGSMLLLLKPGLHPPSHGGHPQNGAYARGGNGEDGGSSCKMSVFGLLCPVRPRDVICPFAPRAGLLGGFFPRLKNPPASAGDWPGNQCSFKGACCHRPTWENEIKRQEVIYKSEIEDVNLVI